MARIGLMLIPMSLAEKLEVWKGAGVTTLGIVAQDVTTLRTLAELVL